MISETSCPASHGLDIKSPAPLLDRLVTSADSLHGLNFWSLPFTTTFILGVGETRNAARSAEGSSLSGFPFLEAF
jgi:hypothetical protein